jgi:hypothetical protein
MYKQGCFKKDNPVFFWPQPDLAQLNNPVDTKHPEFRKKLSFAQW